MDTGEDTVARLAALLHQEVTAEGPLLIWTDGPLVRIVGSLIAQYAHHDRTLDLDAVLLRRDYSAATLGRVAVTVSTPWVWATAAELNYPEDLSWDPLPGHGFAAFTGPVHRLTELDVGQALAWREHLDDDRTAFGPNVVDLLARRR